MKKLFNYFKQRQQEQQQKQELELRKWCVTRAHGNEGYLDVKRAQVIYDWVTAEPFQSNHIPLDSL